MKHIIKVEVLENLPETRPLIAMDANKNIKQLPKLPSTLTLTFVNTDEDYNWNNPNNWDLKKVPSTIDTAIIDASVNISNNAQCNSLIIDSSDAIVTVLPTGGLTVGKDGISGASKDNLILKAGTEGVTKGQTGYLRISPEYTGEMPEATVELFSIAYYNRTSGDAAWQCVGAPIADEDVLAKNVYTNSWIYSWDESKDNWVNNRATLIFETFIGYLSTQIKDPNGRLLIYEGTLVSGMTTITKNLSFTSDEKGNNLISNSFVSPIDITKFKQSDFINAKPEIRIVPTATSETEIEYTINITTEEDIKAQLDAYGISYVIPSMQGFWVTAIGSDAKLVLDYERLVWNNPYPNIPMY